MIDDEKTPAPDSEPAQPAADAGAAAGSEAAAPPRKATRSRRTTRVTSVPGPEATPTPEPDSQAGPEAGTESAPAKKAAAPRKRAARTTKSAAAKAAEKTAVAGEPATAEDTPQQPETTTPTEAGSAMPLFQAPAAAPRKRASRARTTRMTAPEPTEETGAAEAAQGSIPGTEEETSAAPAKKAARAPRKRAASARTAAVTPEADASATPAPEEETAATASEPADTGSRSGKKPGKKSAGAKASTQAQEGSEPAEGGSEEGGDAATNSGAGKSGKKSGKKSGGKKKSAAPEDAQAPEDEDETAVADPANESEAAAEVSPDAAGGDPDSSEDSDPDDESGDGGPRRRRRRGGRRRRRSGDGPAGGGSEAGEAGDDPGDSRDDSASEKAEQSDEAGADGGSDDGGESGGGSRRRRRRRRSGDSGGNGGSNNGSGQGGQGGGGQRNPEDEITSVSGSTRLEAKKQRRREGREAGRRRAPIVSEAEFLARRESVDRTMVIRQREDLTQIAVLEDDVLVEHYVARESQTSLIGNVYLGKVQNVLPSMEAAFVDIGKGRNAVIYAGEVNWQALGHKDGQARKIESVLSSGQTILVQVTKDPVGHKGARLTGQISLPGRFLVYVPEGTTSGISRKLPDTERHRLKTLLKQIVPDGSGVIVRTAAEGASEEELTLDVERLTARWEDIAAKVRGGSSPQLLYGEPDLTLKVVRDLFTEDFARLVIEGDDAWDLVDGYVSHVAPELRERLERHSPAEDGPDAGKDAFAAYRIDEQIAKGLDRKVWLPSGGSLIIDRTEAMTVVDVNTGKFTGSGGNLEETVTKNNLEAAEEMVRQLRLRDIGGIIVIDFIDMVLESNRDLVLRRLVECLGRDRTRHQVAEVTSLGLVQMTRKRIGTGLLEAFSDDCDHCKGRGLVLHDQPVEQRSRPEDDSRSRSSRGGRGGRSGRGGSGNGGGNGGNGGGNGGGNSGTQGRQPAAVPAPSGPPSPAQLAHTRPPERDEADQTDQADQTEEGSTPDPTTEPAAGTGTDSGAGLGEAAHASAADVPSLPTQDELEGGETGGVVGRPVGAASEPQEVPSTSDDTAAETGETAPAAPPVDPAPRLVTSSRRRSARRPAGPPQAEPAEVEAPRSAESSSPVSGEALAVELDESDVAEVADAADSSVVPDEVADDESSVAHVPVKRKGSRRR